MTRHKIVCLKQTHSLVYEFKPASKPQILDMSKKSNFYKQQNFCYMKIYLLK